MRVLPAGRAAVLVEVADTDEVLALHHRLRVAAQEVACGLVEVVPAARTVLVEFDPKRTDVATVTALVASLPLTEPPPSDRPEVLVEVRYDGADLDEVCALLGRDRARFVGWHTAQPWQVAFTGFVPGFGYLVRADHRVEVPRLDTPRPRVPAGSVAMAGPYTGVYPRATPGGWRVVGTTEHPLFDPAHPATQPWAPGSRVRFVAR